MQFTAITVTTFKFTVNAENEIPDVDTNTSNSVEAEQNKTNKSYTRWW